MGDEVGALVSEMPLPIGVVEPSEVAFRPNPDPEAVAHGMIFEPDVGPVEVPDLIGLVEGDQQIAVAEGKSRGISPPDNHKVRWPGPSGGPSMRPEAAAASGERILARRQGDAGASMPALPMADLVVPTTAWPTAQSRTNRIIRRRDGSLPFQGSFHPYLPSPGGGPPTTET